MLLPETGGFDFGGREDAYSLARKCGVLLWGAHSPFRALRHSHTVRFAVSNQLGAKPRGKQANNALRRPRHSPLGDSSKHGSPCRTSRWLVSGGTSGSAFRVIVHLCNCFAALCEEVCNARKPRYFSKNKAHMDKMLAKEPAKALPLLGHHVPTTCVLSTHGALTV